MQEKRHPFISRLPNTRFKALLSNNHLNLRCEVLWETFSVCGFSWDDLITYELYLQATLGDTSETLKHTNRFWEMLCSRDYPNIKITHNFRHEYLSQLDVLNKASPLGKQDLTIIRALFDHQPDNMKWQYSLETLTQRVRENHNCLNDAVPEVRNNKTLMLAAVMQRGRALEFASEELRNDRDFILAAVRQNVYAFPLVSKVFRNDREIVLAAVRQQGCALEYASKELRNDRELVLAAVGQDGCALQYASVALRNDRAIVLEAIKHGCRDDDEVLGYLPTYIRNDREIVLEFVKKGYFNVLKYKHNILTAAILNDQEIFLEASKKDGILLCYASKLIKNNRNIVLEAVKNNGRAFDYASTALKFDPILFFEASRSDFRLRRLNDGSALCIVFFIANIYLTTSLLAINLSPMCFLLLPVIIAISGMILYGVSYILRNLSDKDLKLELARPQI